MTTETLELASFFEAPEIDSETYERYADAAHVSFAARERFESLVSEYRARVERGQGEPLRLALGLLALGRFGEALEQFGRAPAGKLRHVCAAQAAAALGRWETALEELKQAARLGWDACDADLRAAAVQLQAGQLAAAEKLIARHEARGQDRAEWYFVRGLLAEYQGDRTAALASYERALVLDPDHVQTLFHAARLYDLLGEDEQALALYERLTVRPRAYVNALINTAVIYEDTGRYNEAIACLRRVLKAYPNHRRARLFLKDVESCRQMVIQDVREDRTDARARLLDMPLSEFELSVRARNCLKKMNIRTVGELIQLSEAELLAYKNFGETSLAEIKALLERKGLRLGQRPEEVDVEAVERTAAPKVALPPGQEAVLSRPVSELELSVRARRCLQRLNVQTLGDLIQLTESDLLATRNFGVTSLNEVKARLAEHGLHLAPKKTG